MKTKYKIILITHLLFCLLSCAVQHNSNSDDITQTTFIKDIGDSGISRGVTVEETSDGGYILTGYTTDGEFGEEDILLIKTNSIGETIWRKTFGGNGKDYGWAVRQLSDGDYIIVGYTDSFGSGGMDIYLIKTDPRGNAIWTKTYGGKEDEFGWDIRITKDQGFIIAAQTNSVGNGEIDAYLVKVDGEGKEEWMKSYGGDKIDRVFSVQQTKDGGYIAVGITYSYASIDANDRDGYLVKTDALGKEEWHKTFGKDAYDVGHAIALTNDGGFFITGYGESLATSGNRDVYLIKTDNNGDNQWIKVYGGLGEERGIKGYQTKDGGYIAIGYTDKNRDVYLIKTDNMGDSLWTRTYGNKDNMDFGYTVRETNDGGFILVGHSQSLSSEKSSVLLIKTNSEGLVTDKISNLIKTSELAIEQKDYALAITSSKEALEIYKRTKDSLGMAESYYLMARASALSGDFENAIEFGESGSSLCRKIKNFALEYKTNNTLSWAYFELGKSFNETLAHQKRQLFLVERLNDNGAKAMVYNNYGYDATVSGTIPLSEAIEYSQFANDYYANTENHSGRWYTLMNLTWQHRLINNLPKSEEYGRLAVKQAISDNDRHAIIEANTSLGETLLLQNKIEEARPLYEAGLEVSLQNDDRDKYVFDVYYSRYLWKTGQKEEAIISLKKAIDFLEESEIFYEMLGRAFLADYLFVEGDIEGAKEQIDRFENPRANYFSQESKIIVGSVKAQIMAMKDRETALKLIDDLLNATNKSGAEILNIKLEELKNSM